MDTTTNQNSASAVPRAKSTSERLEEIVVEISEIDTDLSGLQQRRARLAEEASKVETVLREDIDRLNAFVGGDYPRHVSADDESKESFIQRERLNR
jgi:hypothetical protein